MVFRRGVVVFWEGTVGGERMAGEEVLWDFPSLVVGVGDFDSQAIFCLEAIQNKYIKIPIKAYNFN